MTTSPSDEILHRMCIGLRVPELRSELHRRGKDESGKRAELVERLVSVYVRSLTQWLLILPLQLLATLIMEIHLYLSWVIMASLLL